MNNKDFKNLINQVKETSNKGVYQKVVPLKKKTLNEIQFSFYIDKDLLKELKIKAIEDNKSIKSLINSSIKQFIMKN